jgi:DNA-binding transcriptional ArsR family regulator
MAEEKFLLVSLKEDEAKHLAQVISNDTSRKILDHLSNIKDDTETNIAKKLKVPISTVHYNIKALIKAKLIHADEFHYSQKGKEVNHYSLANKYVIIAPKNAPETLRDKLKKILPVIGIIGFGTALVEFTKFFFAKKMSFGAANFGNAEKSIQSVAPAMDRAVPKVMEIVPAVNEVEPVLTKSVDAITQTAAETVTESATTTSSTGSSDVLTESVAAITDDVATKSVELAEEVVVSQAVEFTAENEVTNFVAHQSPSIFISSPTLWFLYGAVLTIVIFVIVDYVQSRKK